MNTLAGYYALRAPEYERIYQKPERQADLSMLRKFVAESFADRSVLEIACGTGWWTEILAHTARSVIATDCNEEVLAVARSKGISSNVSFQCCDAFDLRSISREFDAGLAAFWWSHLTRPDLGKFLHAFAQKLQPGSTVVFIDNLYVEGSSTPLSRRDAEGNTYQLRRLDDGSTTEVLKNFPTDEELRTALSGWTGKLTVQRLTYFWAARFTLS